MFVMSLNQRHVMQCHSIRPVSISTCKMTEIIFSDSDLAETQCAIKSTRLFSDKYTFNWIGLYFVE
jgi:hypothetical protein